MPTTHPDVKNPGQDAGRKANEAIDEAKDTASGVVQTVQDAASNVAQKAKDVAAGVTDKVEDAYTATAEKVNEFNDDVMGLIKRHPKQAMLIGFGVGCLVGAVLVGGIFAGSRR